MDPIFIQGLFCFIVSTNNYTDALLILVPGLTNWSAFLEQIL